MGQFLLGIRSLLIKSAVFVVMAALLAWALGGTLWPGAHVIDTVGSRVIVGGDAYFWRLTSRKAVGEDGSACWELMVLGSGVPRPAAADGRTWNEGAGPVTADDIVWYGGRDAEGSWSLVRLRGPSDRRDVVAMPDRLAVEQQLARLSAGLPLQDAATILRQRRLVLDPPDGTADQNP
jgi:hypothetical protein